MASCAPHAGTSARAPDQRGGPSIAYQPALDGLRAVAVGAVMLYHGGVTWMRGGFLGVDVFFVLSGYLITTLLLAEWGRRGSIDLAAFWARRARRLLPALGLVLVGVAAYAAFVAEPSTLASLRGDALAAIGYAANWRFVLSGQSYFEQFASPSPLRHMWSLAIEEQFYLLWPFIVWVLARWRPRLRFLTRAFVAGALASALLMAVLYRAGDDPSRVYYGTDTRVQSLFVGAALAALLLRLRTRRGRPSPSAPWVRAGVLGAGVLMAFLVAGSDHAAWMYRGGYLVVALAVAAVIAAAVQPRRNLVRSALSWAPLRGVGKVSYGLYLWHWPVYLTITDARTGLSGTTLLVLRLAATGAVALGSYFLVEMPVRRGAWPRSTRRSVVAAFAGAGVLALTFLGVASLRDSGVDVAVASPVVTTATMPGVGDPAAATPVPAGVLVVGDSVAKTLGDGFDREAHVIGMPLYNRGQLACGLAQRARIEHGGRWDDTEVTCDDWPVQWKAWIDELAPAVSIAVFDVFVVQDIEVDGRSLDFGTRASDRYLLDQLDRGVDMLRSGEGKVVLLTAPYNRRPQRVGQPVEWDEDDPERIDHWNALLRRYVERRGDPEVTLVDLNRYLSPKGEYTNVRDGVELRYDGVHFNPDAGQLAFRWLLGRLPASAPR
jgi:peptidoglycan/LPS O-acetylase OafA/YrhL